MLPSLAPFLPKMPLGREALLKALAPPIQIEQKLLDDKLYVPMPSKPADWIELGHTK